MTTTLLRVRLLEAGVPQYIVAAYAGIHPSTLSEYALGKPIPACHQVPLCEVLHCQLEDIVGMADD